MEKELVRGAAHMLGLLFVVAIILAVLSPPPPNQGTTCVRQYCHEWSAKNFSSGLYERRTCCHCREFGDGIDQSTYGRPLWMTTNSR